ncbi:hypothetical protein [Paraburkholderia sediminicola]|uniref:hypothetical protein n=1 Tax=Paraburkholderia sediminicola TaxID=458836 RepID=UPI0038BA92E8
MDDQQSQHYRKQANDVIRLTLSRIREEQQRIKHRQAGRGDYAACELTLTELKQSLTAILALRKSIGK